MRGPESRKSERGGAFERLPARLAPPRRAVEARRVNFGVFLVSNGTNKPYRCKMRAGETHEGDYCQSLERAELVRTGGDVTIFCYSRMRYVVMQVRDEVMMRSCHEFLGS